MSLETENALREMGLSSYEIAAYVTLLENGKMTAKNVSEKGRIPHSKIYAVLNSLINKGWIKSDERRPNKYFPISPLEALTITQQKLENKLQNWKNTITNELQILFERMELVERPDVLVLYGHQRIMVKLEEMIKKATKEIMIAVPEFVKKVITSTLFLQEAWKKRQLNIRLMITKKQ